MSEAVCGERNGENGPFCERVPGHKGPHGAWFMAALGYEETYWGSIEDFQQPITFYGYRVGDEPLKIRMRER